ncbi:hypothetical protein BT69DRAFT_1344959 [Atractiella rhizophila]|nr:hypothetical protein BT69DRAFT_1344959 [Atractiella rhizophila]
MTREQESLAEAVFMTASRSSKLLADRRDVRSKLWESALAMTESRGVTKGKLGMETLAILILLLNAFHRQRAGSND